MMVRENLQKILQELPPKVQLIAVSKTKPLEDIIEAYEAGQKVFGENKVQEMVDKHESLPKDIQWHMIGHLQTNKVKYIAPFVSLIHSVDSEKLLMEIEKQGKKIKRKISCLLQIHIAQEEHKFGFSINELSALLESDTFKSFEYIQINGVMGMASYVENEIQIRQEFRSLKNDFDQLKSRYFLKDANFKEISMGMSGDYSIAIEEGSTMIRIGGSIFGSR